MIREGKFWREINSVRVFCVAARYHNITKAAKELFVTQPSISNAIKALEEEFGVNLFFRNNNKLTLTPEGELFYNSAEELLAHADSVESEFHELRKKITPIRIGIPPMLGTIYLPARSKPVILCWKKNWILQLSMQNSLPLTNVIQRSSIQKTFFSVFLLNILWLTNRQSCSPCLPMNH